MYITYDLHLNLTKNLANIQNLQPKATYQIFHISRTLCKCRRFWPWLFLILCIHLMLQPSWLLEVGLVVTRPHHPIEHLKHHNQ